jgi:hypothetical protein
MIEEGFVSQALNKATSDDGRWVANQGCFNFPDNHAIDGKAKAAVVTALGIYNHDPLYNMLDSHIERALAATTQGEIRAIVAEVEKLLSSERHN